MQQKHLVFYISLLELAPAEVLILMKVLNNYLIKQERQYKVKQILEYQDIYSKQHYLFK